MTEVYNRTETGPVPVRLSTFKDELGMPATFTSQDSVLTAVLGQSTNFCETYTRRDFRENVYTLQLDEFPSGSDRFCIRRDPVKSVDSITYISKDTGLEVTLDAADYYIKKDVQVTWVILQPNVSWPSDAPDSTVPEGSITVNFTTEPYNCEEDLPKAVMRLAVALWTEKGDCTVDQLAKDSGVTTTLGQYRVQRVPRT